MMSAPRSPSRALPTRLVATLLASSTALVTPGAVAAQTADSAYTLDEITITGTDDSTGIVAETAASGTKTDAPLLDTPGSVSVVTAAEIEMRQAKTLTEAVAYTAGVSAGEFGSDDRYDYIRIRGFDEMALGTYRDGLPVRGYYYTYARREPYAFDRIEVLKGSNSALFGLNAPGGLVNAVTKMPKPYKFGEVYTTLGDGHVEVGADVGDVSEDGVWSYRLTGKWQDGEYSYGSSNDDRAYLAAALTWRPSEATELTLMLDHGDRDGVPGNQIPAGSGVDPDTYLGEPGFNRFDTRETSLGWIFSHEFDSGARFRQVARYTRLDLDLEQVYGAGLTPATPLSAYAIDSETEQFAIDNQLSFSADLGGVQARTLIGLEFGWFEATENELSGTAPGIDIFDPVYCGRACVSLTASGYRNLEMETRALYVQEELTFGRLIATLGARYDEIDLDFTDATGTTTSAQLDDVSTRFGLTYKMRDDLSVYANYSESFEPDFYSATAAPKEGEQLEIGVKYRPDGMNALFTAALFDLDQTNISTQVSPGVFEQIGKMNVKGLELEGKMMLGERTNLTLAYSYWDAEIVEDGIGGNAGNRPSRIPEHLASVWADYTIPGTAARGDTTIGLGARYVGSTFGDDANTTSVDSYLLFDAAIRHDLTRDTELSLAVSNLADTQYVTTSYFGNENYGDGRTIRATLRHTW